MGSGKTRIRHDESIFSSSGAFLYLSLSLSSPRWNDRTWKSDSRRYPPTTRHYPGSTLHRNCQSPLRSSPGALAKKRLVLRPSSLRGSRVRAAAYLHMNSTYANFSHLGVCVCVRERERDRQTDTDVVTDRGGAWKKREEFEIRNTTCNGGLDILLQRNACWKGFFFFCVEAARKRDVMDLGDSQW